MRSRGFRKEIYAEIASTRIKEVGKRIFCPFSIDMKGFWMAHRVGSWKFSVMGNGVERLFLKTRPNVLC